MNSYNDVLKRILEIIKLSEDVKNTQFLDNRNFISINHFSIYKEYADEFKDLLNTERTIFLLNKNKNNHCGKKNYDLIKLCQEEVKKDEIYRNEYMKLYEILIKSFKHTGLELIEHSGYYILKEYYEEFLTLCQTLKVGPNVNCTNLSKDELKTTFLSTLSNKKDQYLRIKRHYEKIVLKRSDNDLENADKSIEIPETIIEEVTKNTEPITDEIVETTVKEVEDEGKLQTLTCDFKEIIFLGMNGLLNVEMVVQLKAILDTKEFKKLLDLLLEYNIFDERTIINIKRRLVTKFRFVTDINDLVAYFAVRRGINIDSLKALIPSIGEDNYHYLIDQLFLLGTFSIDEYKNYMIENELLATNGVVKK